MFLKLRLLFLIIGLCFVALVFLFNRPKMVKSSNYENNSDVTNERDCEKKSDMKNESDYKDNSDMKNHGDMKDNTDNIKNNSDYKYILTWTPDTPNVRLMGWSYPDLEGFQQAGCAESRCYLTNNRSYFGRPSREHLTLL